MTKFYKFLFAVLLFVTACSLGYIFLIKSGTPISVDSSAKDYVNSEATIIKKKTDKDGREHVIVSETNNVLPKNLMIQEKGYDVAFVDSLISQTDIQKKEITALTQINQTIQGKNLKATAVIDSLQKRKYEYKDSNVYLSYTPDSDATVPGTFDYKYNQKLNIIQYNRKKWLLGADHKYMDIASDDINGTINGVRKLSVQAEEKDFGVKVTGKTIFLPHSGNLGVGGQLRIRHKKITATGSNLYFPHTQKWLPVIGLEYDLLNY